MKMMIVCHNYCYFTFTFFQNSSCQPFFPYNHIYNVFQADTRALKLNAWKQLALEEGMWPASTHVQILLFYLNILRNLRPC